MSELHQMVEQVRQSALCHAARARQGLLTNVNNLRMCADESVQRVAGRRTEAAPLWRVGRRSP